MPELEPLLDRLIEHEVEFVVIGGLAAVTHGASVRTQDLDICCPFTIDNLMRLQQAIADLHPVHRMTPDKTPLTLTPDDCRLLKNLYIGTDLGQLDCLGAVTGLGDYAAVGKESVELELAAGRCKVLGIDALIRAKEAMGAPKDMHTVLLLKAIKERWQQEGETAT